MELDRLTQQVMARLFIPLEASGRHVHLTEAQSQVLFGHLLTPKRPLSQPGQYLANERAELRKARGISQAENNALWKKQIEVLTAAGMIENKALSAFTMEEARNLINYMYTVFDPHGTELKAVEG